MPKRPPPPRVTPPWRRPRHPYLADGILAVLFVIATLVVIATLSAFCAEANTWAIR